MLKLIHAADLHLDSPFAGLRPERAAQRRREQRQLLERLAALAAEKQADLVLLAGDLLDGGTVYQETAAALAAALGAMPCPVLIAPGNHDYFGPDSIYAAVEWPEHVHIFTAERPEAVVLRAVFRLQPGNSAEIKAKMDELLARRKASQPLEYPSAGSTFKRPEGHYAAALIDQCGLKGLAVGGAQVSEKHAGFVINRGGATCADVTALMAEIQRRVRQQTGVELEPEVRVIE